jgi:hypothetical protein
MSLLSSKKKLISLFHFLYVYCAYFRICGKNTEIEREACAGGDVSVYLCGIMFLGGIDMYSSYIYEICDKF